MPGGLAVATQQANRANDRERELRQRQQRRDGWLEANAHLGPQYRRVYQITDPERALGPEPRDPAQWADRQRVRTAGKQVLRLLAEDLTPRRILTRDAFENAIVIHAAIGGSTNALLHLPPVAHEAGVEITIDDFDRIHRQVPVLANVKSTGRYPVDYFWYAGGVPAVMLELRDMLHLDCMTVTGKTLGENLEEIEQSKFFSVNGSATSGTSRSTGTRSSGPATIPSAPTAGSPSCAATSLPTAQW
jgi:hypothetical protein